MTTQQANARLASDLKAVVRDAEELMKAKATCHRLEERTVAAARATDLTIREHPYESIGIAFGVGLLVGVLVARK